METLDRTGLVARWLELTRVTLPGLASRHGWPIALDHCFMRVCLDNSLGRPWREAVRAPAIRHLTAAQLRAAIAIAERIVAEPGLLDGLNRQSLRVRGHRAA
jgi:hypothetical protein